jgi:hypothetical protein
MKRHLLKLVVFFGILALAAQAHALLIEPDDYLLKGDETGQSFINAAIASTIGSSTELYKQEVGGTESGSLAGSYQTTFFNTALDPSDALIEYVGGDIVGPTAFLLIKDGNQDPAWYLFNLTDLGWTGVEDLSLEGFWPNGGAISHVALYGGTTTVPEPGTLLLLGSGLVGLALFGRKSFKR